MCAVVVILSALVVTQAVSADSGSTGVEAVAHAPASPVTVDLDIIDIAGSMATVTVTVTTAEFFGAANLEASIALPPGFLLLDGS